MSANGTATQQGKLVFKPRKVAQEARPDIPEGKWTFLIVKGGSKLSTTAAEKGSDPMITFSFKAHKAHTEGQETFQGTVLKQRVIYYDGSDSEKVKGANANYRFASALAEATGLEVTEVYPEAIESEEDLVNVVRALEGKTFDAWTTHRTSEYNGETMVNVDIRFKEPGTSGLVTRSHDDDENDERPGRRTSSKSSKGRR